MASPLNSANGERRVGGDEASDKKLLVGPGGGVLSERSTMAASVTPDAFVARGSGAPPEAWIAACAPAAKGGWAAMVETIAALP